MRTVLLLTLALCGCASRPIDPRLGEEAATPLTCSGQDECAAMWRRAQVWLVQNGKYRIQTVSDAVIVTFGPQHADPSLAYTVTRVPGAGGKDEIDIDGRCDNVFGCVPTALEARARFKRFVRAKAE